MCIRYYFTLFVTFFFTSDLLSASYPQLIGTSGDTLYLYNEQTGAELMLADSQLVGLVDIRNKNHHGYITDLQHGYIELDEIQIPLNTIDFIYYEEEVASISQVKGKRGVVSSLIGMGIGVASLIGLSNIQDPVYFEEYLTFIFLGPILLGVAIGGLLGGLVRLILSIFKLKQKPKKRIVTKRFRINKYIMTRFTKRGRLSN